MYTVVKNKTLKVSKPRKIFLKLCSTKPHALASLLRSARYDVKQSILIWISSGFIRILCCTCGFPRKRAPHNHYHTMRTRYRFRSCHRWKVSHCNHQKLCSPWAGRFPILPDRRVPTHCPQLALTGVRMISNCWRCSLWQCEPIICIYIYDIKKSLALSIAWQLSWQGYVSVWALVTQRFQPPVQIGSLVGQRRIGVTMENTWKYSYHLIPVQKNHTKSITQALPALLALYLLQNYDAFFGRIVV